METLNFLQTTWFMLIGVLLLGYSILDGFDLGIGTLLPFLAGKEEEKKALLKSIGPFWDGNEVWLLTGAGALFASFPHAYATVFSGFYLAMMLVLFALIFRAVSIEFMAHDEKNRKMWEWCFIFGSFLPSLLYGVALGNVVVGIPLDGNMEFTGNFFTLLRPFPLAAGLLGLNAILLQGTTYAALKSTGDLRERARSLTNKLLFSFIILFILCTVLGFLYIPGSAKRILAWLAALVVIAGWILLKRFVKKGSATPTSEPLRGSPQKGYRKKVSFFNRFLQSINKKGKDTLSFYMSSLIFAGLWGIVAAVHFPYLVRASSDLSLSLTVRNASSSALTLKVMLIIALIGMPLVLFYTYYIFKTFKGKVKIK